MKQARYSPKQKSFSKDHGKDLSDVLLFLLALMAVLWYLKV
jgi:hypothetical protein